MRERERERKKNNTEKVHRTNNGGSEVKGKGKGVFGTHTKGVFGTTRRAGRRCRGRRGRVSRVVRGGSRSRRRDVVVFIHLTRRLIGWCVVVVGTKSHSAVP